MLYNAVRIFQNNYEHAIQASATSKLSKTCSIMDGKVCTFDFSANNNIDLMRQTKYVSST